MRTLNIVVIILVFIFGIYQMRNASSVLMESRSRFPGWPRCLRQW